MLNGNCRRNDVQTESSPVEFIGGVSGLNTPSPVIDLLEARIAFGDHMVPMMPPKPVAWR